jgi:hypothetical protein
VKSKHIFPFLFICLCISACVTKSKEGGPSGIIATESTPANLADSLINTSYPPLSRLKNDLMKSAKAILTENPDAVMTTSRQINMGKGGYFGGGQFYGYTWQLKNGLVDQANFIMEYDVQSYNDWIEKSIVTYGKGRDLNGNGILWLIPEKEGITLFMANITNGGNKLIITTAGVGYVDLQ